MPAAADDRSSQSRARFGVMQAEAAGSGAPSVGLALHLGAEGFGGNGVGSGAPKMVGCRLVTVVSAGRGVQPVLVVFVQAHAAAEQPDWRSSKNPKVRPPLEPTRYAAFARAATGRPRVDRSGSWSRPPPGRGPRSWSR